MARWLVTLGILGACTSCIAENYLNHTLFRLLPASESEFDAVYNMHLDDEIQVLKTSRGVNDSMDLLVPPDKLAMLQNLTEHLNLLLIEKKENYGKKMDDQMEGNRGPKRRSFSENPAFQYRSFGSISRVLEKLERAYRGLLTLQPMGRSYEGRVINLVRISNNPRGRNPAIFIDAGIHAREWVAPCMALYIIHKLVSDPKAVGDLQGIDWLILPVVNPDGYEYTRRNDRMWRKTRSKQTGNCYGVDGNRNYGFKWAVSGVSRNPCDKETYAGPRAFSEPETQIVKKVMHANADRIKLYISLHSYGQYLVYPWGYTGDKQPKAWQNLDNMANIASAGVVAAGGPPFKVLMAGKWYPAAGGSDDYAFGAVGIPYSYTMELTEGHEFIYPENELSSILPKFYGGIRAMANQIKREFPYGQ